MRTLILLCVLWMVTCLATGLGQIPDALTSSAASSAVIPPAQNDSATPTPAPSADGLALNIAAWLSAVSFIALIVIFTLRSIADVLISSGFAPGWLTASLDRRERLKFAQYLEEVGLIDRIRHSRALNFWMNMPKLIPHQGETELCEEFLGIARDSIDHHQKALTVGSESKVKMHQYLNLRRAFCKDGRGEELTKIMAAFVKNRLGGEFKQEVTCVISRKTGLDLLGYSVATWLRVPFVLFHDDPTSIQGINGFEYLLDSSNRYTNAIIIDDSCVGGAGLLEMANRWRSSGAPGQTIINAFVFFVRTDKQPELPRLLREQHIVLHALCGFNDSQLEMLVKSGPEAVAAQCKLDDQRNLYTTNSSSETDAAKHGD